MSEQSTSHSGLAKALARVQAQLPAVSKSSKAEVGQYSYTYANLAEVSKVALKLLGENGLAWMTMPTLDEHGDFVLRYELVHESGESRVGHYPLPKSDSKPQSLGSAITYGRRYCLSSVVGIATEEDDDGQAAQEAAPFQRRPRTQTTQQAPAQRNGVEQRARPAPKPQHSDDDLRERATKGVLKMLAASTSKEATALASFTETSPAAGFDIFPGLKEEVREVMGLQSDDGPITLHQFAALVADYVAEKHRSVEAAVAASLGGELKLIKS